MEYLFNEMGTPRAERGRSPSAARGQAEALWKRAMSSGLTTRCEPGRFAVQCNAVSTRLNRFPPSGGEGARRAVEGGFGQVHGPNCAVARPRGLSMNRNA